MKTRDIATALVIGLLIGFGGFDTSLGVCRGCCWQNHFLFHFAHGNIFHLLANMICVYSLAKGGNVKVWQWLSAFAMASAFSVFCAWSKPLVGLSGVLFAVCGMQYAKVDFSKIDRDRKVYIFTIFILPFVIGLFFGQGAALLLHILCFAFGYGLMLLVHDCEGIKNDMGRY